MINNFTSRHFNWRHHGTPWDGHYPFPTSVRFHTPPSALLSAAPRSGSVFHQHSLRSLPLFICAQQVKHFGEGMILGSLQICPCCQRLPDLCGPVFTGFLFGVCLVHKLALWWRHDPRIIADMSLLPAAPRSMWICIHRHSLRSFALCTTSLRSTLVKAWSSDHCKYVFCDPRVGYLSLCQFPCTHGPTYRWRWCGWSLLRVLDNLSVLFLGRWNEGWVFMW